MQFKITKDREITPAMTKMFINALSDQGTHIATLSFILVKEEFQKPFISSLFIESLSFPLYAGVVPLLEERLKPELNDILEHQNSDSTEDCSRTREYTIHIN